MESFLNHVEQKKPSLAIWAEEFATSAKTAEAMHEKIREEQAKIKAELDRMEKNPREDPEQQLVLEAVAHQFRREHRQLTRLRQALTEWTRKGK